MYFSVLNWKFVVGTLRLKAVVMYVLGETWKSNNIRYVQIIVYDQTYFIKVQIKYNCSSKSRSIWRICGKW